MPAQPVHIGRVGENEATKLLIDVGKWVSRYPDISISIRFVRPGESVSYTAAGSIEDGTYSYYVTGADTGIAGSGMLEIVGISGNKIVASATAKTLIE